MNRIYLIYSNRQGLRETKLAVLLEIYNLFSPFNK